MSNPKPPKTATKTTAKQPSKTANVVPLRPNQPQEDQAMPPAQPQPESVQPNSVSLSLNEISQAAKAAENLNLDNSDPSETRSSKVDYNAELRVGRWQLISWWEDGLLATPAYILLAFKLEQDQGRYVNFRSFDIDQFISEWAGTINPKTGEPKLLTREQVAGTLFKLEAKEKLRVRFSFQLTLEL